MPLITEAQARALLANGVAARRERNFDPLPVVKLGAPWVDTIWLLSDAMPEDPDYVFAVRLVSGGSPDLRYVRLSTLEKLRGPNDETVECDETFVADRTFAAYIDGAMKKPLA
ncbi:MAG: DUF2958 domain-containing protein [Hyphomicrobiales bacterium]|nr:DUF2958 domain-containing protein [Hyphomicrobiales bacterium]